jgi:L-ribulose-5-phosphate 3-epimerase
VSDTPRLDRRELLAYTAACGSAFVARQGFAGEVAALGDDPAPQPARVTPRKRYDKLKKSINLWAFPYPDRMSLTECFQLAKEAGFDGVEVNYNLEGDLSPEASDDDFKQIGETARRIGIEISGVCSFLFWPYPLTSNDAEKRAKGLELAGKMVDAAALLGTKNLLVVPGAVYIPWAPEPTPVPNDVCWERSKAALRQMIPRAEGAGVSLNLENIFANGFLMSPAEMNRFVDDLGSDSVGVHFDTGNIMQYQFPEHWIRQCGKRIRNVHLKEYDKRAGNEFSLFSFRSLLAGSTDWPAVLAAFDEVGYEGYLTFEYFHPFEHWPEALVFQTSEALDWMLGRRT